MEALRIIFWTVGTEKHNTFYKEKEFSFLDPSTDVRKIRLVTHFSTIMISLR